MGCIGGRLGRGGWNGVIVSGVVVVTEEINLWYSFETRNILSEPEFSHSITRA